MLALDVQTREIAFGPFKVCIGSIPDMTELYANGEKVELTMSQRRLFTPLARRPDFFIAKAEMYKSGYGGSVVRPDPKVIDVITCGIRSRISAAFADPIPENQHYLVSDFGGGYGIFSGLRPMRPQLGRSRDSGVARGLFRLQAHGWSE